MKWQLGILNIMVEVIYKLGLILMNKAWSKYHLNCPYCNKIIKVHIIFKKKTGIETVTERADIVQV